MLSVWCRRPTPDRRCPVPYGTGDAGPVPAREAQRRRFAGPHGPGNLFDLSLAGSRRTLSHIHSTVDAARVFPPWGNPRRSSTTTPGGTGRLRDPKAARKCPTAPAAPAAPPARQYSQPGSTPQTRSARSARSAGRLATMLAGPHRSRSSFTTVLYIDQRRRLGLEGPSWNTPGPAAPGYGYPSDRHGYPGSPPHPGQSGGPGGRPGGPGPLPRRLPTRPTSPCRPAAPD